MRIIGGKYRGKKLITPQGSHIRPTTDRMRETLFNILEHGTGPGVRGVKVLDLFAGSGALGMEALSRAAESVTFVDNDRASMKLIRQNTALINDPQNAHYVCTDGMSIKKTAGQFDLIFIDPPYHKNMITPVLENIHDQHLVSEDGVVIIEYAAGEEIDFTESFAEIKQRKIGDAVFSILEYSP